MTPPSLSAVAGLLGFALLGSAVPLQAQQLPRLDFDGKRQVFVLTYEDDDGQTRSVEIVGGNRIAPSVETSIRREGASLAYGFRIRNGQTEHSSQPIGVIEMSCPESSVRSAPDGWSGSLLESETFGGFVCHFFAQKRAAGIQPGSGIEGFTVESSRLPGITRAKIMGLFDEFPALPGSLGETPRDIAKLYNRALGVAAGLEEEGGWKLPRTVGPAIPPVEYDLTRLREQLEQVCDLGWISNRGVCNSLRKKLRNAGRSLEREKTKTARNQIRAFVKQLEAQNGPQPGKHVDDNAFALLKTNAEFLLERL